MRAPDYEPGGREFESLRARQHFAPSFRAKNYRFLRFLQGADVNSAAVPLGTVWPIGTASSNPTLFASTLRSVDKY